MNGLRLAGSLIAAAALITTTASCSLLPGHQAVAHSGASTSSTTGAEPTADSSNAASAPRPADLDLSGVTKACPAFKSFDVTKGGVQHGKPKEADDDTSQSGFKVAFPMADRVVSCGWLDDDSLRSADVGVVDGMGVDRFTPAGGWHPAPMSEFKLTTMAGYRTFEARHTMGIGNCQAMVDIHDDQILWVRTTDQNVDPKKSSFASDCADIPALVADAVQIAKQI